MPPPPSPEEPFIPPPSVPFPAPLAKTLVHAATDRRIAIWWDGDSAWYPAMVLSRDGDLSRVLYEDGVEEVMDMRQESWRYRMNPGERENAVMKERERREEMKKTKSHAEVGRSVIVWWEETQVRQASSSPRASSSPEHRPSPRAPL